MISIVHQWRRYEVWWASFKRNWSELLPGNSWSPRAYRITVSSFDANGNPSASVQSTTYNGLGKVRIRLNGAKIASMKGAYLRIGKSTLHFPAGLCSYPIHMNGKIVADIQVEPLRILPVVTRPAAANNIQIVNGTATTLASVNGTTILRVSNSNACSSNIVIRNNNNNTNTVVTKLYPSLDQQL